MVLLVRLKGRSCQIENIEEEEGILPNSLYEDSNILVPKPDKGSRKKLHTNIPFEQISGNQIPTYLKKNYGAQSIDILLCISLKSEIK